MENKLTFLHIEIFWYMFLSPLRKDLTNSKEGKQHNLNMCILFLYPLSSKTATCKWTQEMKIKSDVILISFQYSQNRCKRNYSGLKMQWCQLAWNFLRLSCSNQNVSRLPLLSFLQSLISCKSQLSCSSIMIHVLHCNDELQP